MITCGKRAPSFTGQWACQHAKLLPAERSVGAVVARPRVVTLADSRLAVALSPSNSRPFHTKGPFFVDPLRCYGGRRAGGRRRGIAYFCQRHKRKASVGLTWLTAGLASPASVGERRGQKGGKRLRVWNKQLPSRFFYLHCSKKTTTTPVTPPRISFSPPFPPAPVSRGRCPGRVDPSFQKKK